MSKNYLFDLIADTSGAISGFENTTSINDSGLVAAIGQFDSIEDLLVGDGETPVVNLSNRYNGKFSSGIEINNDNKIVARDTDAGFSTIRLWDVNAPGSFSKNIATGRFGYSSVDFENTLPFPRLSNNSESDLVTFLADPKGGGFSAETALVTFAGQGFNGRNYNELSLSNDIAKPAIADDGTIVIKNLEERIVLYDYQLNLTNVIASNFKGFSSVGESPGISDEGGAIVFYGNLTNPGADSSTEGLDPGEGIFVSIETDAGRKIERIAGIAGNGILDPGETHEDTNENGEVDLGEDTGLIGSFSTDERDRFGINFNENTSSGDVVFLAKDELGQESIINSNFKISTDEEVTLTTVKSQLLAKAGQEASNIQPDLTGNIQDLHIYDPINKSGQIAFWAETTTGEEAVVKASPIRKPVFILPGIGGSFPRNEDFGEWLLDRGVAPDTLEIDYLANTYDDLIQTLENAGYQQGVDLFVANYDWRLNPGPIDGNIDGRIERSVEELTDDTYEYAVDQLGFWLEEAITGWKSQFSDLPEAEIPDLDSVDIIAHSTGGLVARSYIQSDAYGAAFTDDSGQQVNLPTINNFISIGVPSRGASKAWRPTQNDFFSGDGLTPEDSAIFLIHKILRSAYQKVTRENNPKIIALSGNVTSDFAINNRDIIPTEFIEQYVPTLKSLLATYPFFDSLPNNGNLQRIEEIDPSQRNSLALDLNNGYDSVAQGTTTDPNLFVNDVELATIIYGENEDTPDAVEERDEPDRGLLGIPKRTVQPIENRFRKVPEGIWYEDREGVAADNPNLPNDIRGLQGDGTVPLQSSLGQFLDDSRIDLNLILKGFNKGEGEGGNTEESIEHGGLVSNTDVQRLILETLGINNVEEDTISTGLASLAPIDAGRALWGIIFDPVEGFLIDGQGRRLGYSEATGAITEIPNTFWLGEADGIGFVQDTLDGPLRLELTGLGEEYFVSAEFETEDGPAGIEVEGFLADGEELTLDIPLIEQPTNFGSPIAEYGTIANLTHNKQTIDLINTYTNPVVFVQPPSYNGTQEALVRLDNITNSSFEAIIAEPNYHDGRHLPETASYFVFEAGSWQLPNGTLLEVGTTNSEDLVPQGFNEIEFDSEFLTTPVIISTVQTNNDTDTDFVRTRQTNATEDGFSLGMEQEQALQNSGHATEELGWLAIEPGSGAWGDSTYIANKTGDRVTHEWSNVSFNDLFDSPPQLMAGISTYDGIDPVGLRYQNLNSDAVEIKAQEDASFDSEIGHTTEVVDFLAVEGSGVLSAVAVPAPPPMVVGEVGKITNLNHNSQTIELNNTYTNPVVFAMPLSYNGGDPALARITDIEDSSFSIYVQEADYLDGLHANENFSYLVLEAGVWELEDGTKLEVGSLDTDKITTSSWESINFNSDFSDPPAVLSNVQTDNGTQFVRTRQRGKSADGFRLSLEEEEALKDSGHATETVGWLAMETGSGSWSGFDYTTGSTAQKIDHEWDTVNFERTFDTAPSFLASISSYEGADPGGLRYRNLGSSQVQLKVEEDTSFDSEIGHVNESIDFLAVAGTGNLTASSVDFI